MDYKVGDRFLDANGEERKILAVLSGETYGFDQTWYATNSHIFSEEPVLWGHEDVESEWTKIEPFFEEGKSYRYQGGVHIYLVTKVYPKHKRVVAELDGVPAVLDEGDFGVMTEVR